MQKNCAKTNAFAFFVWIWIGKEEDRMLKEGKVRIPSGCAIAAVISREGKRMTGESVISAMKPMHDRSNGLGGGFAGYGIYPEYKTICIRTDGNDKIATGHIQRCLSIARAIRESDDSIISQTNVIFIVSDKKSEQLLLERFEIETEFPIHIHNCAYTDLADEADSLFDCISQFNPSCLLIDSYYVSEDFFKKLHESTQKAGIKLAYIDDQQILDKYDIDVMINYSTVTEPVSYMSVPVRLCGKIYTPLRKQFSECRYEVRDEVKDIFISSGGTDPYGISLILCNKLTGYNLHILTSSLNRDILKLRKLASSDDHITVYEGR